MSLPENARTLAKGLWIYDGVAKAPVTVISLPFDYWYELAKGDEHLEPGEEPKPLGPEGVLYYASFTGVDSPGYPTVIQAKADAQTRLEVAISWTE
ncbi:hypothetical protein BH10PSE4_BH10PSE4_07880 [soil metagenome]